MVSPRDNFLSLFFFFFSQKIVSEIYKCFKKNTKSDIKIVQLFVLQQFFVLRKNCWTKFGEMDTKLYPVLGDSILASLIFNIYDFN